ncbi:MAG: LysR family transcriptional regulator, partial [Pseudomonadota bacterium]
GLERSTVSRRITSLEDRLGVSLLERSTRRLRLTEIGRQYYQHCLRVVEATEDAEAAAMGYRVAPSGVLNVGAILSEPDQLLSPLIADFVAVNDRIHIELSLDNASRLIENLKVELLLHTTATRLDGFSSVRVGTLPESLWCSPAFLSRNGTPTAPEMLRSAAIIDLHAESESRAWQFERGRDKTSLRVFPRFRVASLIACRDACRSGVGIARLPDYLSANDELRGDLVRVLPDWRLGGIPLLAAYRENQFLTRKAKAFVEFLDGRLR